MTRPEKAQILRTDVGGFTYRPDEADEYMALLEAESQRMRKLLDEALLGRLAGSTRRAIESFLVEKQMRKIQSECCKKEIHADERYCPRCGWECRIEVMPKIESFLAEPKEQA